MLTTVRFANDLGADHYKTAASEGWGNLVDHPAPDHAAAYQHNQTDLECLRAELRAVGSDFFRPNPNGDGTTVHRSEQGFMDYTDDSCMGLAAERNRHRVSDGTSNTLLFSEG